jgi:hypothetical protein
MLPSSKCLGFSFAMACADASLASSTFTMWTRPRAIYASLMAMVPRGRVSLSVIKCMHSQNPRRCTGEQIRTGPPRTEGYNLYIDECFLIYNQSLRCTEPHL